MKEAFTPLSSTDGSPVSLKSSPLISDWVSMPDTEGAPIHIHTGKVELGQHILTALIQIAADALAVPLSHVRVIPASTHNSPDESVTSGSLSIQHSGMSIRAACRHARYLFQEHLCKTHGIPVDTLTLNQGLFLAGANRLGSYASLAPQINLNVPASMDIANSVSDAGLWVNKSVGDISLPLKVNGSYAFINDLYWPGMLYGAIVRPPSIGARLLQLDDAPARRLAGVVHIAQDGSLVGVLATHEHIAEKAREILEKHAAWQEQACLPEPRELVTWMKEQPHATVSQNQVASHTRHNGPVSRTWSGDFFKPFLKHAPVAPSCAIALWAENAQSMQVWSHSQGIYNLRTDLALVLEIPEHAIQVHHRPGSGCYGHNGADDVAFDAAWLSRYAPGKHVRVQWTRRDEFCWAPQSPPMAINIQADTDSRGTIIDWRHTVWGPGHSLRPGRAATSTLLGSWYQQTPQPVIAATNAPLAAGGGSERNMRPCYDINCSTIDAHRILTMPIRTSSLRSLGALANVFAIESMLDDIAHEHQLDPIAYRLQILADPRGRKVLQAVHELSAWKDASNGSNHANDSLQGLGVGYAQYKNKGAYCAVVAKVSIRHEVRVEALYIAVDVGEVINPDGVRNQIEGGAVQATSMALLEQAHFDAFRLTDTTWNEYPILRFSQAPAVHVEIINNPDHAPVGAGEASLGPTVAAIGNAIRAATGARLRSLPFSFDSLSQAI